MRKIFSFKINKIDLESIHSYLINRNNDFTPPLSEKLDIYEFASKMFKYANIYTVSYQDSIVGMTGCYANNFKTLEAYITNTSIHPSYYGTGLASELMKFCIKDISSKGFKSIKLEVHKDNARAINFYKKMGFEILEDYSKTSSFFMAINLIEI